LGVRHFRLAEDFVELGLQRIPLGLEGVRFRVVLNIILPLDDLFVGWPNLFFQVADLVFEPRLYRVSTSRTSACGR
jgi:hypothetical protein